NFTLPIARQAGTVIGIEGAESLVERGRENAQLNGINNVEFAAADLTRVDISGIPSLNGINRVLLDPPRSGAIEVLPAIAALGAERIVYVSCGPATFARDAGELVNTYGYELEAVGVMDMFPHTSHAETMGVFVRSV
ncbi:MAG: 23S rRNA (uracil(1939)-C(5))-methyltransferase, partial [Gammaproteobacteria bacterium]|nr:23S rRNA (uracil(1939)-C(5))-methyltransferase [Gammaproteobacteria bacterium]